MLPTVHHRTPVDDSGECPAARVPVIVLATAYRHNYIVHYQGYLLYLSDNTRATKGAHRAFFWGITLTNATPRWPRSDTTNIRWLEIGGSVLRLQQ